METQIKELFNLTKEELETQLCNCKTKYKIIKHKTNINDILKHYNYDNYLLLAIFNDNKDFFKLRLKLTSSDKENESFIEISVYNKIFYGNHYADKKQYNSKSLQINKDMQIILRELYDEVKMAIEGKKNTSFIEYF